MTATLEVLGTPELLEMILALLPTWQIREVKQVSKTWRDLVRTSVVLQKARVVHTLQTEKEQSAADKAFWHGLGLAQTMQHVGQMLDSTYISSPTYDANSWIRLNPLFRILDYEHNVFYDNEKDKASERQRLKISFEVPDYHITTEEMEQFATEPPCRSIGLSTYDDSRPEHPHFLRPMNWTHNTAYAYNRKCLQVKDIIHVRNALRRAQRRYRGRHRMKPTWNIVADFHVISPVTGADGQICVADLPPLPFGATQLDKTLQERGCGWPRYFAFPIPRFRQMTDPDGVPTEKKKARDYLLELEAHNWLKRAKSMKDRSNDDN